MKQIRLLLAVLLLWMGVLTAWAYDETVTVNGITYEVYSDYSGSYAKITRIETNAISLDIPNKVSTPRNGMALVTGFSYGFTCNCPNLVSLYIKESTYHGKVAGDFSGMKNLSNIYFYDPSKKEPATGLSWSLDSDTQFSVLGGKVTVYLSHLVAPNVAGVRVTYFTNDSQYNVIASWKNHYRVEEVRCTFTGGQQGSDGYDFGVAPYAGSNFPDKYEAALLYINPSATWIIIPGAVTGVTDYVPQNWKIKRFGYPGVTTSLNCSELKSLSFRSDITIDKNVDFGNCFSLEEMQFYGDADISNLTTTARQGFLTFDPFKVLKKLEFWGDAILGSSLSKLTALEKVYFYGNIPDDPEGLASLSNTKLTVYVNLDKYEIADFKAAHTSWSNVNMQPIDPSMNYRKVTINNPGEGTFEVQKVHDGTATWETVKPNSTKTIEMDKNGYLLVRNCTIPESSNYRFSGFVFNGTTVLYDDGYGVNVTEKTNTLTVHYRQLAFPVGTVLDIHLTKVGDGQMEFRPEEENGWACIDRENDEWQELVDMSRDGEERNYTTTYYDGMELYVSFSCIYKKPVDGIVEQSIVIVNGVPAEPYDTYESGTEYLVSDYSVEIDGDMDIQIIHQNNARKLSVVNGAGGSIALFREGQTDSVGVIGNATTSEQLLPKDVAHYAVITPETGKEVFAVFVNKPLNETARLQLDASQYLQEDGTYRVPLTGLDEGDGAYRLSVLYVDRPSYVFNLAVVGDGSMTCTPFRDLDGDHEVITEVTASESEGRNKVVRAFYDEIGETGYVEFWLKAPKEGESVKVYKDGEDVTSKFHPMANLNNEYLRGTLASTATADDLGVLTSASLLAIYEENSSIVDWKATMAGDVGDKTSVVMMVDGGTVEKKLSATSSTATASFNPDEIGTLLQLYVYLEPGKSVQMLFNGEDYTSLLKDDGMENGCLTYVIEADGLLQFFVDGTWTFCFSKTSDIIDFADAEVKRICVENWDTNGDGELSKAEAAAVTTLKKDNGDGTFGDPVFMGNTTITSFDELQYFTELTSVEENAFFKCTNLTSVIVPKNVKTIEYQAFTGCKYLSVVLPEGLTKIGVFAFGNCSYMKKIKLPESLERIERSAFADCFTLNALYIPKNVNFINFHNGALTGLSGLLSIVVDPENATYDSRNGCNAIIVTATNELKTGCRNTIIPEGVTSLYGFVGQYSMTSIEIPASVKSIIANAFLRCRNLTSVVSHIENPVAFGENAFGSISADCVLTVPCGTRQAYIDAGWTEDIFKGGIVEAPSKYDVNEDGSVSISDVTKLVNKILGRE